MKKNWLYVGGLVAAVVGFSVAAQEQPASTRGKAKAGQSLSEHILVKPKELKWQDGPPSLPRGVKVAVIEGDLAAPDQLFTARLMLPANTRIAPHFHPADEHLTVISGELLFGMGERFDEKALETFPPGGFVAMPKDHRHFAMTRRETVLQLHGVGPWGITYVNPEDDPSRGVGGAGKQGAPGHKR